MVAINASDILNSYMQGANFVAEGMHRAEQRQRQEQLEQAQSLAGDLEASLLQPMQRDADGKLVVPAPHQIANSPTFLKAANHPLMQPTLMHAVAGPDVASARMVAAQPGPTPDTYIPVIQGYNENGIATGQAVQAPPINIHDSFLHGASTVYGIDPKVGHDLVGKAHEMNLQTAREYFLRAKNPDEKEQILQAWGSQGYDPESIYAHSGVPTTIQHANSWVEQRDPVNNRSTFTFNPEHYNAQGKTAENAQADTKLEIAQRQLPETNAIEASQITNRVGANANANLANAPTVAQTSNILDAAKENQNKQQNAEKVQGLRAAYATLDNPNATAEAKTAAQFTVDQYAKDPESARLALAVSRASRTLDPKNIGGLLAAGPEAATTAIIENAPYRNKSELEGLYADVARRVESGDRTAAAVLPTLRRATDGASADKSESFKPGDYNATGVKSFLAANEVDDAVRKSADLNGPVAFTRAVNALQSHGIPVPKNSVNEAALNRVTAMSMILQKKGQLSDEGVTNTIPALWSWEQVAAENDPASASNPDRAEAYVRDVYMPLSNELKAAGVSADFGRTTAAAKDVMALQKDGAAQKGLSQDAAIKAAVNVEKDPKLQEEIRKYAIQTRQDPYDVLREWTRKGWTSAGEATVQSKAEAVRKAGGAGLMAVHPELNRR
jgi:hypothetical protein